jgi:hypothetical protein
MYIDNLVNIVNNLQNKNHFHSMQIISFGNFYLGKDKQSYTKFNVHIGTYRLEYERPRLNNDGVKPPQESD